MSRMQSTKIRKIKNIKITKIQNNGQLIIFMRLDLFLLNKYSDLTRNKIQHLIKHNSVFVDGNLISKNSFEVNENNIIEISTVDKIRVGRAGYKLANWFKDTEINIKDFIVLDIGASTGGFTEVLLEQEASKVYAVDVGTSQLVEKLKNDSRVVSIENMDIRQFNFNNYKFDFITCDVSFISLSLILKDIDRLANNYILLLFKPQFEVGREIKRNHNGVVKDDKAVYNRLEEFKNECRNLNWIEISTIDSKINGKEGNKEIFLFFQTSKFVKILCQ